MVHLAAHDEQNNKSSREFCQQLDLPQSFKFSGERKLS